MKLSNIFTHSREIKKGVLPQYFNRFATDQTV